jgi:hypothetical protein
MAARKQSRNFGRMLARNILTNSHHDSAERPNVRDAFIIEHTDGSAHRSTEPCEICRKLAATNAAPIFTTDDPDDVFIRHGGNDF